MAVPIGIAYTAKRMDLRPDLLGVITGTGEASSYGSVLLILTLVGVLGLVVYRGSAAYLTRRGIEMNTRAAPGHSGSAGRRRGETV